MSLLTPLYLLGGLAVALPILAHLIRRTPPRRREFSSVMFLSPSQPTITRRSRIEHWPLLCLRALAILLLAIAFARPLWRTTVIAETPPDGKWIAVLVDTSASMRRDGFWEHALAELENVLNESEPADRVGVFTFDAQSRLVSSWEAWSAQSPSQRTAAVLAELGAMRPGWSATDLGQALLTAEESLQTAADQASPNSSRQFIVIGDLQSGSRLNALQGHAWPENVSVRLVRIGGDAPSDNAGLQPAIAEDGTVRLRLTNADDATLESFDVTSEMVHPSSPPSITAATPSQPPQLQAVVPAGQSLILRAPELPPGETAAVFRLSGDAESFDNNCYVVVPQPRKLSIVCLGSDSPTDPSGMRFFLAPLFSDTPHRQIELADWEPDAAGLPAVEAPVRLLVLTGSPTLEQVATLRGYVRSGGLLIHVLTSSQSAEALARIAELPALAITEAEVNGFSLLTDVDFSHPAFSPFSDPKYSDFTKLHFWKHRRIDLSSAANLKVLARFDNGDLAIGELPVGNGRVMVFTSGWNKADSQLAVWSKFVPLMNGLLESADESGGESGQFTVDDPLPWRELLRTPTQTLTLNTPDVAHTLTTDSDAVRADSPGIYTVYDAERSERIAEYAVNLAAAESQTAPLELSQLEALGIPMTAAAIAPTAAASDNPLDVATIDLEQRQRLWRWVLVAVIVVLVIETACAGWLTNRRPA